MRAELHKDTCASPLFRAVLRLIRRVTRGLRLRVLRLLWPSLLRCLRKGAGCSRGRAVGVEGAGRGCSMQDVQERRGWSVRRRRVSLLRWRGR